MYTDCFYFLTEIQTKVRVRTGGDVKRFEGSEGMKQSPEKRASERTRDGIFLGGIKDPHFSVMVVSLK